MKRSTFSTGVAPAMTMLAVIATAASAPPAAAAAAVAKAADWNGQAVRIQFGAEGTAPVTGKVTRTQECLYVKLDAPRDGLTLIRLDQVRRLELRTGGGWVAQDVGPVLKREPAHCLEEANG